MGVLFRFETRWELPASPAAVTGLFADLGGYPRWWPQVRRVSPRGDDVADVLVRSALPYALRLVLTRDTQDVPGGRLRVGLAGDLRGWAQLEVTPTGTGSAVRYRQEVRLARPVLAALARPLGPALRANHAWMMRGAARGSRAALTGRD